MTSWFVFLQLLCLLLKHKWVLYLKHKWVLDLKRNVTYQTGSKKGSPMKIRKIKRKCDKDREMWGAGKSRD